MRARHAHDLISGHQAMIDLIVPLQINGHELSCLRPLLALFLGAESNPECFISISQFTQSSYMVSTGHAWYQPIEMTNPGLCWNITVSIIGIVFMGVLHENCWFSSVLEIDEAREGMGNPNRAGGGTRVGY